MKMEDQHLKTFKDFLTFYNLLSETCFGRCVSNMTSRSIDDDEANCVERCSTKFINCNNRLIKIYAVLQEKIVTSRMKAIEEENLKQQALLEQEVISQNTEIQEQS